MSSKNQSESTATAQEEMAPSLSSGELSVELPGGIEAVTEDLTETGATDAVAGKAGAEETAQVSSEQAVESSADSAAAPEFKVTDKRRFLYEEAVAEDDGGDASDPTGEAAFEIDLDQMKLDAQAVEREMEELRTQLKASETRRDEAVRASEDYADRFRRAQAQLRLETEEMRGRLQRTFEQKLELARGDVVASLLDTLDNLQRAVGAAATATEPGAAFEALRDGVRATAEMFEAQLQKMGLHAVASVGETFNPELHEAVELALVPPEQDHLVLAELQRGYKFGERLLRPARVKVGRAE